MTRAEPAGAPAGDGQPEAGIGSRSASGVIWLTLQTWAVRIFGLVTIAILTRLVSPEDFGAVAAASATLPFFYLLADLGFSQYIIQAKTVDQRMLSTGFWFSACAGVVLGAALVALAPLLGLAFGDDRVVDIIRVQAAWVISMALGAVPIALMRRAMRFRAIAAQGAAGALLGQIVAVWMAFAGFGVWALVAQGIVSSVVATVLAWFSARWLPSRSFSTSEFGHMARFGSQVLGVEFVAMLRQWAEAAIVSSVLGLAALGYLNIARRLVQIVQDMSGSAVSQVASVAFAKVRESTERTRAAYLRTQRIVYAALALPLTVVAVAAPLVVPILFGHQWDESYPLTRILALAGILVVGATVDHGLYYGLGKPGTWFVYAVAIDTLTVAATALAVQQGLLWVAWAFLGVAALATVVRWFMVARELRVPTISMTAPLAPAAAAVVVSGAAGLGVVALTSGLTPIVALALVVLATAGVYLLVLRFAGRTVLTEVYGMLSASRLGRFVPAALARPFGAPARQRS